MKNTFGATWEALGKIVRTRPVSLQAPIEGTFPEKAHARIESLDYLRGLMALIVMLFHFKTISEIQLSRSWSNLLQLWSVYAVSAFYVLSGISMAIVYSKRTVNKEFVLEFSIKRFFRIAPIYYVACILSLAALGGAFLKGQPLWEIYDPYKIFLNFSFLFSWLKPTAYLMMGGWSIGNEVFFYTLFPLMLFIMRKSWPLFLVFFAGTALIAVYFAFFAIDPNIALGPQWGTYINPLNQLYLFVGGMVIGVCRSERLAVSPLWLATIVLVLLVACMVIPGENRLTLIHGWPRVVLSLIVFAICLLAANWNRPHNPLLAKVMTFLGLTSYSIYLIHPFVITAVKGISVRVLHWPINSWTLVAISIPATLIACAGTYRLIEKPAIDYARHLQKRRSLIRNLELRQNPCTESQLS